jgi:hypothetical protein
MGDVSCQSVCASRQSCTVGLGQKVVVRVLVGLHFQYGISEWLQVVISCL